MADGTLVWQTVGSIIESADPTTVPDDSVIFSPDGTQLVISNAWRGASGAWSATTRIVRVADGSLIRDLGHGLGRRPSFSPDGNWPLGGAILVHLPTGTVRMLDPDVDASMFLSGTTILAAAPDESLVRVYCARAITNPG